MLHHASLGAKTRRTLFRVIGGLLAMVATGLWIWLQAKSPRWPGLVALGAGVACCGWFVWGVAWFGK